MPRKETTGAVLAAILIVGVVVAGFTGYLAPQGVGTVVSALTALVIIWYTVETSRLRRDAEARTARDTQPVVYFEVSNPELRDGIPQLLAHGAVPKKSVYKLHFLVRNVSANSGVARVRVRLAVGSRVAIVDESAYNGTRYWEIGPHFQLAGVFDICPLIHAALRGRNQEEWPAEEMTLAAQMDLYDSATRKLLWSASKEYYLQHHDGAFEFWPHISAEVITPCPAPDRLPPKREKVKIGPYVQRVVDGSSWPSTDEFPWHQETADDYERLFVWADRHRQFERFLPRLQARPKERDAAIAEIRAACFLESLGFRLVSWEPSVTNRPGEFEVEWPGTQPIFVEVKQPTWESELTEEEKRGARKQQPRYITGDFRWFDQRVEVRRAADKTMGKLKADRPNILVIVDRLFRSPVEDLDPGDLAAILSDPKFTGLGGILCINANWLKEDGSGVDYSALFEANPNAPGTAWEMPSAAVAALVAVNKRPK